MTDAKFEPFEPTNLTPYIDQINAAIREAVEQYVAELNHQIAAFLDATAPSAAQEPAEQGQDGGDVSDAATDRLAPGSPEWGDWVQQIINGTSASAEDLARYFDTPPSARQHDHDWIETTRWCDTGRIHECRCGQTYEEPR